MLTDRYELTMLDSWVRDGSVEHRAVFEVFARRLPEGRRYGILAGLGRLLPLIADFGFDTDEVDWLVEQGVVGEACAAYLRDFRFRGDVDAYREGDLYFPDSPVLTVTGTLGECVVLETLVLSVLNHDTAVASAAARMVTAAAGRPADRHGEPAYPRTGGGRGRTSRLPRRASPRRATWPRVRRTASRPWAPPLMRSRSPIPARRRAFSSQVEALGVGTTLLVDTFDTAEGIRTAVDVAGPGPRGGADRLGRSGRRGADGA